VAKGQVFFFLCKEPLPPLALLSPGFACASVSRLKINKQTNKH